jgi:hypothetical protein
MQIVLFIFAISLYIHTCFGFLNKIQLQYTKYILSSPGVPENIRDATKAILVENYQPWLKNQYKSFVRQHTKTMNKVYVKELYQYAVYGLLESLQAYDGSTKLHVYANKFVHGRMYSGMNELAIMKPISLYNAKKGIRTPKPVLVSPNDYWMFDKLIKNSNSISPQKTPDDIREIIRCAPSDYRRLFWLRYDHTTLDVIRDISTICEMEGYSYETYRKKMNAVLEYIREQ